MSDQHTSSPWPTLDGLALAAGRRDTVVRLDDFYSHLPTHKYIFTPTNEFWPRQTIDACLPRALEPTGKDIVNASVWLDRHRSVEQTTWSPGDESLIKDRLVSGGGWVERLGSTVLNMYVPSRAKRGESEKAGPWIKHVNKLYKTDSGHIIDWLKYKVQCPGVKINHALVLGGSPGIGKDSILEPVKYAIGAWNFQEVSPQQLLGRFNGFLQSVILRVSEARDLGEVDRFKLYDHMKTICAAPPDVLRIDEKNVREHYVLNVCGVVITTNHRTDGLYLPADDRRHFVAWSELNASDFDQAYWNRLYAWYDDGGKEHVAAYLAESPIITFDPKAPPPKTSAFWDIVDAHQTAESSEMADALDACGRPDAVTLDDIRTMSPPEFRIWLDDRRYRRQIPHRLEECGYVQVRNSQAQDGCWLIERKRQRIYGLRTLSAQERQIAAVKRQAF